MIRVFSILIALLLGLYILVISVSLKDRAVDKTCESLEIIVRDSLNKHFVNEQDVISLLKRANLSPIDKPMYIINTDKIEEELMKNQMISRVEAYKTPSGKIKLEVTQKIPLLRIMSIHGSYYVDNAGQQMPLSPRYVAHVPIATGYIEKDFAMNDLYKFALFLHKDEFWNNQIDQIYISQNNEVELVPRIGNHRILLGTIEGYEEKLDNLQLFYKQAIPKMGWNKYSVINLKYKNQIVCTKK
ncbi:cell division protein FtsQ [Parabacteroides sp. OttesenSCG-928-K15]|nr:cell division protein FtsQ [Parabacteroides sp. OttesenSCG-928-K15]